MYNCIFNGHCNHFLCDRSCPTLAETSYLLERNNITMNNAVFKSDAKKIQSYLRMLDTNEGSLKVILSNQTVQDADLLTYCGICKYWKGSRLHCTVYNLKYAQFIEMTKKSWSTKSEPDDLEYMRIWSQSAKLLIISNIDFINFRDFECQTLLTLLQSRSGPEFTTIVVSPPLSSLVGDGPFFGRLTSILKEAK